MLKIEVITSKGDISDKDYAKLQTLVSEEKMQKANRLIKRACAQNTLLGEVLAKEMLAEALGINESELSFGENEFGKPYLIGVKDIYFNISHSNYTVACAISSAEIGIDIQCNSQNEEAIARRFFTEDEQKYIFHTTKLDMKTRFKEIWSMKESYIKMRGKGLAIPLNSFDVLKLQKQKKNIFIAI